MPVKIHGKEYFTVAERLNILKEDCKKKKIYYSLVTDVIGELDGTCLIKARITLADKERTIGVYTGHAMEKETSINEIVLILDDINDKDFTTKIMAQIDKKEINKSNYNRCLTKLDKMIKDQNAK